MTEREWWSNHVRPALHRPELGCLAEKVQDAFKKGAPDVDMISSSKVLKLELKYWPDSLPDLMKRDIHKPFSLKLSAEQSIWLGAWYSAGGRSGVLCGFSSGEALYMGWRNIVPGASLMAHSEGGRWYAWKKEHATRYPLLSLLGRDLAFGTLDEISSKLVASA